MKRLLQAEMPVRYKREEKLMSKYKFHEDFADIPDSRKGAESKLLLAVGNSMLRAQTRKVKPDPARVTEAR